MAKVLFSSWKDKIIDERERSGRAADLAELNLPQSWRGAAKGLCRLGGAGASSIRRLILWKLRQYFKVVQQELGCCVPAASAPGIWTLKAGRRKGHKRT